MLKSIKTHALLLASASIFASASGPALAQTAAPADEEGGIGEIVVTAEHRQANVQDIAAAVTVVEGDTLREEGKYLLRDILESIPGVNGGQLDSVGTAPGGGTDTAGGGIVIRGIRSNLGSGGTITSTASAVAVYTDDVYEGVGSTYDVDRVEVLRGPQGTLYGRSATGGVVAIHTANPSLSEVGGFAMAEMGDYSTRHFSAAITAPLIEDKLGVRVAGDYFRRDGFDSAKGVGHRVNKNARIKLLAKPSDALTIMLGAALQDNEDASGGRSAKFDKNGKLYFTTLAQTPTGAGKNKFRQVWANMQLDLGFATLTYIPAYREWKQDAVNIGVGPGFNVIQKLVTPKDHFFTNELRLNSNGDSKLIWQVGALSYYNKLSNSNSIRFDFGPLAFSSDTQKKTTAFGLFGEVTYPFSDALRVTGGLRYDKTKITVGSTYVDGGPPFGTGLTFVLPNGGDNGKRSYNNWTYKIRGEADVGPENMVYVSYSTGFSPGDVTVSRLPNVNPGVGVLDLKAQTLKAFEIGSKNRFLSNTLQVNAALYHYNYSGYQNAGIDVDERGGAFLSFVTLVSPLRVDGGEVEMIYQPTPADRLAVNLAYTDARYVHSSAFFKTIIARRHVHDVPPFTANIDYSHRFELGGGSNLTLGADARYLSAHDAGTITQKAVSFGGVPFIREGGLVLANARANWTSGDGKFSLGAYVRNITDKRYSTLTEHQLLAAPPTFDPIGLDGGTYRLTAPRTFGVIATVNF